MPRWAIAVVTNTNTQTNTNANANTNTNTPKGGEGALCLGNYFPLLPVQLPQCSGEWCTWSVDTVYLILNTS